MKANVNERKARRTCNADKAIKGRGNNIGGVNHSVKLGGIDHVSGKTRDRSVAGELKGTTVRGGENSKGGELSLLP